MVAYCHTIEALHISAVGMSYWTKPGICEQLCEPLSTIVLIDFEAVLTVMVFSPFY